MDEPRRVAPRRDTTPAAPATRRPLVQAELGRVIVRALHVARNELGPGLLESVYEAAVALVLAERGVGVERQHPLDVHFRGQVIGTFRADLLVERSIVVELKAARTIEPAHEAQLINYMRLSCVRVGILANFAERLELRRYVL